MSDALRFDGRVAVVTGAGRGLGREHALLLAARGAAVVVNDVGCAVDGEGSSAGPAQDVVAEIGRLGGRAVASNASVADDDGPASVVRTAMESFGRIDVLVNNAGIMRPGRLPDITTEDLQRLFEVHVLGTLRMTQAAWPHFVAASYGRIVNTASRVVVGMPGLGGYAAMKGAIVALTKTAALEGEPHGIVVNALAPSGWSRMADSLPDDIVPASARRPDPVAAGPAAAAAAFLAHESCPLRGEVVLASGGVLGRLAVSLFEDGGAPPALTPEDVARSLSAMPAAP